MDGTWTLGRCWRLGTLVGLLVAAPFFGGAAYFESAKYFETALTLRYLGQLWCVVLPALGCLATLGHLVGSKEFAQKVGVFGLSLFALVLLGILAFRGVPV